MHAWGLSWCRITTLPVSIVFVSLLQLPACCCRCDSLNSRRYSNCHRFQKWLRTTLRCFIRLVRWSWVRLKSSSSGSSPQPIPSGRLRSLLPIRKWAGVSGSCKSSGETYVRGRELITISTSIREVSSSSYMSLARPMIFFKHRLVERTICSNMPPHQGLSQYWISIQLPVH